VKKRKITWLPAALLVALLSISATAARPVSDARTGGSESAIVWIAQDGAGTGTEQRVQILARAAVPETKQAVLVNYQSAAKSRQFAASLYQRPPPSLR
jgi:hypothetical protein